MARAKAAGFVAGSSTRDEVRRCLDQFLRRQFCPADSAMNRPARSSKQAIIGMLDQRRRGDFLDDESRWQLKRDALLVARAARSAAASEANTAATSVRPQKPNLPTVVIDMVFFEEQPACNRALSLRSGFTHRKQSARMGSGTFEKLSKKARRFLWPAGPLPGYQRFEGFSLLHIVRTKSLGVEQF